MVAEGVNSGRRVTGMDGPGSFSAIGVVTVGVGEAINAAGVEAAGRFDEQAANPIAINRLDTNMTKSFILFPIKR
jgi:hypothetical protein